MEKSIYGVLWIRTRDRRMEALVNPLSFKSIFRVFLLEISIAVLFCASHRHLKEIDRSSVIVGGPAAAWAIALNLGANQYTGPAFSAKACFMVAGNINTNVNKGRRARPMSGLLI